MCDSIQRLFMLRQFPGFGDLELSEVAAVSENIVEVDYAEGATVALAGRMPAVHLITEGKLVAGTRTYGPRQVFGGLAVVAGGPTTTNVIAAEPTRTLQIAATDFAELLEDNFGLLSN